MVCCVLWKNLDKPAQHEPELLTQHRCWTSLMLLNGSRSLWKVFPEEWKLLQQQVNYHGFGMRCNVHVSHTFGHLMYELACCLLDFELTELNSFSNLVQFGYSECDNKAWPETAEHQVYNNWFKSWVNSTDGEILQRALWKMDFPLTTAGTGTPSYCFFPQTNTLRVSHSVSHLTVRPVREMWIVCSEPSITAVPTAP